MRLSDVRTIQIELTSYCNAKCPHCPRFDITHHDVFESTGTLHPDLLLAHLDFDKVMNNIDTNDLINLKDVIIEGDKGDPMMHPDIEKILDFFCNLPSNPLVTLVTNGSIRSDSWWNKLGKKNYNNLMVKFSIDGLKDTNHLYRVGLDFDKIMNNVSSFIAGGGRAIWKMIVFKHNFHQISQVQDKSKDMGFESFVCVNADKSRFKDLEKWPVKTEENTHYLEWVESENFEVFHIEKPSINKKKFFQNDKSKLCPNLSNGHIYINHLNHLVPCCMLHFDTELNYFGKEDLKTMVEDFDKIDLSIKKMSEILEQDFFNSGLNTSFINNKWLNACKNNCKNKIIENMKLLNL